MSAKMVLANPDPDFIKERESPRGLESTYSLREVGAGHFSAVFANSFPSGHNSTIMKSGHRGTQAKDKDKAKKAIIGYDYHDYFPQESWPFILRDIGFKKVGLITSEQLEFWTLCEPNGTLVLPRDIKMKSGSNTSHSGQHFGALVADATNTNKNTAFVCRLGAVWDTKTQGVPAKYHFAGAMVSRQQNYQLMLYYSEYYDDIYVYTGDAVQFRKELRQNTIGNDIIIEKIVARLCELMVPEKKTKKPQVKKKVSVKEPVVDIADSEEEEEEEARPVKKKPKAEKEKKQLTEADIVAIAMKAMEERKKEKKAKGEKKVKIEQGMEGNAKKRRTIYDDEDEDEDEADFEPSSPEDDPWEEDPPRPSKGKTSSKGKGKGKGKANFKEEKPKKKKKTEKWDDWEGAESYDTNKDPDYRRKAGLGPRADPVVQEQAMYSEEKQREQIRMQVRAELEAEFEKKRQLEREAAYEREEKEREIQRRVAERERERERERDYDRNQDWDCLLYTSDAADE